MRKLRKQNNNVDKKLLFLTLALTTLGLVALADASAPQALNIFSDKFYFVKQQAVWGIFGLLGFFIASRIHYSFWQKIATPLFILGIIFLIAVLIPGVGSRFLGARRWIVAGPISFQPSEFIKLALVIYLAKVASHNKSAVSYLIPLAVVSGLVMLQPDLGTTIVLTVTSTVQIFASGISLISLFIAGAAGSVISFLLVILSDYRRERFFTFIRQSQDPLGASYHIRQILLALGSGGLLGVGLGQSHQKYLFLPEAASDSIFAVIAEEVGFLGAGILILLFAFFVFSGLGIVRHAPDRFSQFLALGLTSWIGIQTIINISSIVALVPLTGVPLPFFSYGGSSLVMVLLASGILLNISKYA